MKAPGSENTTTVLPLNSSSVLTLFHSLFWRTRKVTFGTRWPSRLFDIRISPVWVFMGSLRYRSAHAGEYGGAAGWSNGLT